MGRSGRVTHYGLQLLRLNENTTYKGITRIKVSHFHFTAFKLNFFLGLQENQNKLVVGAINR